MTEVGKSLVFCLKYYPEMESLDGEAETPISQALAANPNRAIIENQISGIRLAAGKEAADLIHGCAKKWLDDLKSSAVSDFSFRTRKATERSWQLEVTVGPKPITHQIGNWVNREGLTPWVWCRGGASAERDIQKLLKGVETFGSKTRQAMSGGVALKTTQIDWESAVNFALDAGPIIAQTKETLKAINPGFIAKFIRLK